MHGLQACSCKYIIVVAFRIYAQRDEDAAKRGGWRPCINSHGNYIVDHGKSWNNHGIVFMNSIALKQGANLDMVPVIQQK